MSRPINDGDVYRAVAHPLRRKLIDLLALRNRTAGELAGEFSCSWPTVSTHLRVLRMAGLVRVYRKGTSLRYAFTARNLNTSKKWFDRVCAKPARASR